MTKVNGIMIVVCSALALALGQVAQAETDDFESYGLTGNWQPTLGVEGWQLLGYQGVAGATARIVDDGAGDQYLELDATTSPWVGFEGIPMWDADGPADADSAVTKSGFDIRPNGGVLGSEFVAKFSRHPEGNLWWQNTWEFGIRVGAYVEMGNPFGPGGGCCDWEAAGTGVYLSTHQGSDQFITTDIPGFGEGVYIVPGVQGTPAGIIAEWWRVEIEEDNTTQETRARMYLRSSSPGDEDGWTPWQAHNALIDYTGTEGQISGFMGGDMDMDNWYASPSGASGPLEGDINGDGQVDGLDLNILGANWQLTGTTLATGDINGDGTTDGLDLNLLGANWQAGVPAPGATIPEPASLALLTICAIAMLRRRSA